MGNIVKLALVYVVAYVAGKHAARSAVREVVAGVLRRCADPPADPAAEPAAGPATDPVADPEGHRPPSVRPHALQLAARRFRIEVEAELMRTAAAAQAAAGTEPPVN